MSFADREASRADGQPFHLYRFKIGPADEDVLCYTNVATSMSHLDETYIPLPITHGDVVSSGSLDRTSLTVTSPDESDLAELYRNQPPSYVITLVIYQGHIGDAGYAVAWAGRVLGGSFEDDRLELECEPIMSSLRRPGLVRDYQYACPLVLYGTRCRANKAAATYEVTATAVNGPLITLPGAWVSGDLKDKFVGGIAEWTNAAGRTERLSVVDRDGDIFQLSSYGNDLMIGTEMTMVLGCNHLMDDCEEVHDNILNFGGQPEIPLKNPVGFTDSYN